MAGLLSWLILTLSSSLVPQELPVLVTADFSILLTQMYNLLIFIINHIIIHKENGHAHGEVPKHLCGPCLLLTSYWECIVVSFCGILEQEEIIDEMTKGIGFMA